MSGHAINPNTLPDVATEERAALDRETAYLQLDVDNSGDTATATGAATPLAPLMFVPDPRYPHGDLDAIEAHHAEVAASRPQPAPSVATDTYEKPAECAKDHPLIASLIAALPAPHSVWSAQDRADWLRAAECLFQLVYRAQDQSRAA